MNTIRIPEILLPKTADLSKWAVNACDQFTSDAAYWHEVETLTTGAESAYNLIFPEIYLKDEPAKRIKKINKTMQEYVQSGVFKTVSGGFILVERETAEGKRLGIVLSIDLEDYSFEAGSKALVRSTEATILDRIPPRVEIRKNAPVELPHVMLLYDDEENTVLNAVRTGEVLYDFDLMMNGGHIKGSYIKNAEEVISKFYALTDETRAKAKYGTSDKLLFAVGDGNHSLATAKTCWENVKKTLSSEEIKTHPARFALVEAVNIYDKALNFEPIHRLVKTDKPELFKERLKTSGAGSAYIVIGGEKQAIAFDGDIPSGIRKLDKYISEFVSEYGGEVDYIHGENELENFTRSGGVGVELPAIAKDDFFRLIVTGGNLPKKTFSMGEGNEKRYYIEAKLIKQQ